MWLKKGDTIDTIWADDNLPPPHPGGRRRGVSVKCSFADETPGGSVWGIGNRKPVSQREKPENACRSDVMRKVMM